MLEDTYRAQKGRRKKPRSMLKKAAFLCLAVIAIIFIVHSMKTGVDFAQNLRLVGDMVGVGEDTSDADNQSNQDIGENDASSTQETRAARKYLNDLLDKATSTSTHKTGLAFWKAPDLESTMFSGILYRIAARHKLTLVPPGFGNSSIPDASSTCTALCCAVAVAAMQHKVDIFHMKPYVYTLPLPQDRHDVLKRTLRQFSSVVRITDALQESPYVFTMLRDPYTNYISYYDNMLAPYTGIDLPAYIQSGADGLPTNPLSWRFGIVTQPALDNFIQGDNWGNIGLIMLANRFDESCVLFAKMYGYSLIDIAYITLDSKKHTHDSGLMFDDLDIQTQDRIKEHTNLDSILYTHAEKRFDEQKHAYGHDFENDLKAFKLIQEKISLALTQKSNAYALYTQPSLWFVDILRDGSIESTLAHRF